jgi:hypothetical protein
MTALGMKQGCQGAEPHREAIDARGAVGQGSEAARGGSARSVGRARPPARIHAGHLDRNAAVTSSFSFGRQKNCGCNARAAFPLHLAYSVRGMTAGYCTFGTLSD